MVTQAPLRDFTDIFDARKQITSEITALDARARKGKIQRQQYKAKKRELEARYESLTRKIEESKQAFRNSSPENADLIKQFEHAESGLKELEEKIRTIEARQDNQQISLEEYKKSIDEYQRQKEKIEATINGILLRLREKAR